MISAERVVGLLVSDVRNYSAFETGFGAENFQVS